MPAALSISGLEKAYGSVRALVGVDLEVGEGELVGLLGPNGAGKSTLVKIACGLVTPTAGRTGQPDFALLMIDYVPDRWLVESKSLKFYLASFRNHGAFHEDCTVAIGKRIVELLEPHYLRIGGYWYPRGGMPIDVFWQTGSLPAGVWLPDQGVPSYRGRG